MTHSFSCAQTLASDFLIPDYGLSPATTCHFHCFGINETYIVESDSTRFALRLYRPGWRTLADIAYELDALDHLAAKGASVSTSVPRLDGNRITTIATPEGDHSAVLFTFAPGKRLNPNETDSADFGRCCALVHAAADDFPAGRPRFNLDLVHLLDQPLAAMRPHLAHRPKDWDFLQALADCLRQRVAAIEPTLDRGFCHGDLHGGNAHRQDHRLTLFDFDCCGQGCRSYDLAAHRLELRLITKETQAKCWPSFLAGYRQARELSHADLAAVELFIPIRHLWLTALPLQRGDPEALGWLRDPYFDHQIEILRELKAQCLDAPSLAAKPR